MQQADSEPFDTSLCMSGCRRIAAFEGHLPCWSPDCQRPADAQHADQAAAEKPWVKIAFDPALPPNANADDETDFG